MPFCPICGTPVKENHKFCPNCGNPLEPVKGSILAPPVASDPLTQQQTTPVSAPRPSLALQSPLQSNQEMIKVIIPNLMVSKSLGRSDTFNLIVTERRSIFAKLSSEIMNETVKKRRAKAEAEGKGFFGKWKAQMQGFNTYMDWYVDKTPDYALKETPGNYAVDNSSITNVKVNEDTDDEGGMTQYYIEITTTAGKLYFKMQYDPKEFFKKAYGVG